MVLEPLDFQNRYGLNLLIYFTIIKRHLVHDSISVLENSFCTRYFHSISEILDFRSISYWFVLGSLGKFDDWIDLKYF